MADAGGGWRGSHVALAFLAGAAAGAAAAWWLSATPSGRETRATMKQALDRAGDAVKGAGGDVRGALRRAADAARHAYDEAMQPRRD